jgi:large subunit ribosomal protein L30
MSGTSTLKLRYRKSAIGYPKDQHETIRALGFRRLYQTVERPDTPSVRGMVYKVRHLVTVEGVQGEVPGSWVHAQE